MVFRSQSELNSAEKEVGELLRTVVGKLLGHLCLLIVPTQRKSELSHISISGGSFTVWSKTLQEVSSCPRRYWEMSHSKWPVTLPLSWTMAATLPLYFKGMAPRPLRMTFLGCNTSKRHGKDLHTSQSVEKEFAITSLPT